MCLLSSKIVLGSLRPGLLRNLIRALDTLIRGESKVNTDIHTRNAVFERGLAEGREGPVDPANIVKSDERANLDGLREPVGLEVPVKSVRFVLIRELDLLTCG